MSATECHPVDDSMTGLIESRPRSGRMRVANVSGSSGAAGPCPVQVSGNTAAIPFAASAKATTPVISRNGTTNTIVPTMLQESGRHGK